MIPTLSQKTINQKLQIRFTIDYFLITNTLLLIEQNFFFCAPSQTWRFRGGSRGRVQGVHTRCGFLIQLVFCKKNYVVYWF